MPGFLTPSTGSFCLSLLDNEDREKGKENKDSKTKWKRVEDKVVKRWKEPREWKSEDKATFHIYSLIATFLLVSPSKQIRTANKNMLQQLQNFIY